MESSARPKSDRRKTARSTHTLPMTVAIVRRISEAEIARRAFELYCSRGGQHGQDLEDWLRAERELLSTAPAMPTAPIEAVASDVAPKPQRRKRTARKPTPLD